MYVPKGRDVKKSFVLSFLAWAALKAFPGFEAIPLSIRSTDIAQFCSSSSTSRNEKDSQEIGRSIYLSFLTSPSESSQPENQEKGFTNHTNEQSRLLSSSSNPSISNDSNSETSSQTSQTNRKSSTQLDETSEKGLVGF